MHIEFKRGINISEALMIGNKAFIEAFKKIYKTSKTNPYSSSKIIHSLVKKIEVKKNKEDCYLVIFYSYGAGMLKEFPIPLDTIFDPNEYVKGDDAEYFYDLAPKYYERFKNILKNINKNHV